jgi:NAD+ synthase
MPFTKNSVLLQDTKSTCSQIINKLHKDVFERLNRKGGVVGISGGVDSSVCLELAVKALGPDNVVALIMPERDSNPESEVLAKELAEKLKVRWIKEDITEVLTALGCYNKRDEAVKRIFPEYDPLNFRMKIGVNQSGLFNNLPPYFTLTITHKTDTVLEKRLDVRDYLQIVAASNLKQRTRMTMLYYHAEFNYYAVIGTPNKHEREQGFFVKYGDGGADIMPIGNLYKTQVYQLAEYFQLPGKIIDRIPTTDTYPAEQTQEEFFFQLPFDLLDRFWYGFENGYSSSEVAEVMGESRSNVEALFRNFRRKRKTTEYLRMAPINDYFGR